MGGKPQKKCKGKAINTKKIMNSEVITHAQTDQIMYITTGMIIT